MPMVALDIFSKSGGLSDQLSERSGHRQVPPGSMRQVTTPRSSWPARPQFRDPEDQKKIDRYDYKRAYLPW